MQFDTYFNILNRAKERYLKSCDLDNYEKEREDLMFVLGNTVLFLVSMESISLADDEVNDRELTKEISEWLFGLREDLVNIRKMKSCKETVRV